MDKNDIPYAEFNYLMVAAYKLLTDNKYKTIKSFIIFNDGDNIIEIEKHIGQRSKAIDILIGFFIKTEEYEKCNELSKLKSLVIEYGD